MKKIIVIVLAVALLCVPFCSSFATFSTDMAWFRNMYDQLPNVMNSQTYSQEQVSSLVQNAFYEFCRETSGYSNTCPYSYYFIIPSFGYTGSPVNTSQLHIRIFASNSDTMVFGLRHYLSTTETTISGDYPDFDSLNRHSSYSYSYCFVPVSLPDDAVCYSFTAQYPNSYCSLSRSFSQSSTDMTTSLNVLLRTHLITACKNSNTSESPIITIPSIDYLVDNTVSTASIRYQSFGEEVDPVVSDFFSPQSLSVILSTEATYLGLVIQRAVQVILLCAIGLLASLIGLHLLPKVLRRFLLT